MRASAVQMLTLISAFYTEDLMKLFRYLELRRIQYSITAQRFIFIVINNTYITFLTPAVILFSIFNNI